MAEQTGGIELFKMFGDVFLKGADTVNKQLDNLNTKAMGISKTLDKVGTAMSAVGKALTLGLTMPILGAGGAAVKLASDLNETMNKIDVIFGDSAATVKQWAKSSITSMGLAQDSALNMTATIGDMATGMGFTASEAAKLGMQLTQRAADMASFKNISIDVAKTALVGVFTGETESLKQMGVVMTEANLQYYALEKGIKKAYTEMSQQEKVQLRLQYVMEMTNNSAGDFVRTQGGVANQTRMVKESLKELGASMGQILIPAMSSALQWVNKMLKGFIDMPEETKKTIVTLGALAAAIGPVTWILGLLSKGIGGVIENVTKFIASVGTKGLTGALMALISPAGIIMLTVAAIAAIGIALYKVGEESRAATGKVKDFVNSLKEGATAYLNNLNNITKNSQIIDNLADNLFKLSSIESKSNEEKARMASIVGQLNDLMPELNLTIDEQTGLLDKNEQAVRNLIATKRQELYMQAAEQRLLDLYKERLTLQDGIRAAQERLNKAAQAWKTLGGWASFGGANTELDQARKAFILLTEEQDKNKKSILLLEGVNENYHKTIANAYTDTADMTGRELAKYEKYLESAADTTDETSTEIVDYTKRQTHLTQEQYEEQQANLKRLNDELESSMKEHIAEMGKLDEKAIEQKKYTLKELIANLGKQIEAYRNWRDELKKLATKPGLTDDMIAELQALGPEYTDLLKEINNATGPELDKLIALFKQKYSVVGQVVKDEMNKLPILATGAGFSTGMNWLYGFKTATVTVAQYIADWQKQINSALGITITAPTVNTNTRTTTPTAPTGPDLTIGGAPITRYAEGTDFVPRTGLAYLEEGEQVIPPGKTSNSSVIINVNNAKLFNQNDARELANLIYSRWQLAGAGYVR